MFGQGSFLIDPRNQTPESIQRNREVLMSMMPQFGQARYAGQGLAHLGAGIVAGIGNRRLGRAEEAGRAEARALVESLMGGGSAVSGPSGGSYVGTPSTRSAPAALTGNSSGAANAAAGTRAPTAGLRFALPTTDPMEGDPRRAMLGTGARAIDDPNVYTTRVSGATGGVGQDIIDIVGNSVEQAYGPGASVNVSSGHRPGSHGSQHSAGNAIDFGVTDRHGNRSTASDPRIYDAARVAVGAGASGIGIGPDYMGGNHFHFDTGRGGATAPNFGGAVRTWSDWNTTGPRNANAPGGAGDPSYGLQAELQAIRDGRVAPTRGADTSTPVTASAPTSAPSGGIAVTASAQNGGGGSPSLPQLYQALANPWLSAGERQAIAGMIQVQERNADPMRQLQMEQLQLQIEQMRNPQTGELPASVQSLILRAQMAGLEPGTPEYSEFMLGGGSGPSTVINMPGQGEVGTIPQGFELFTDPETGARSMRAIPGGPEDDSNPMALAQAQQSLDLMDMILANPELDSITGIFQGRLPPRNQAQQDLLVQIDQLQGQAFMQAFETLKGGGQITEREGAAATAAIARLNRVQSEEAYRQAIAELRAITEIGLRRANGETVPEYTGATQPRSGEGPTFGPQGGSQVSPEAPEARETRPAPASDRPRWGDLPEGTRQALREAHTAQELADFFEDFTP